MILDLSELANAIATEVVQKLQGYEVKPKSTDELMTITEASNYLKLKPSTLYKMSCKAEIPTLKINGGRLRFRGSDLDMWLKSQGGK